jgi:hydrogenase maturation protease
VADGEEAAGAVLVIGYGNPLRGDDGLGPHVAEALAARGCTGVRVLTRPQLVPELAADLAAARLAVFVDTREGPARSVVSMVRITPGEAEDWTTHRADPRALLALARAIYGRAPAAWWVTVGGLEFGLGEGLSPAAREGARAAVARIEAILREATAGRP